MEKPECDFEAWWTRTGQFLPSRDSLPLSFDIQATRRAMAEAGFNAALEMSRNYVANYEVNPTAVVFANGREVAIPYGKPFLEVE